MTMTRTRRKQKQEMMRKAVKEAEEKQRELREHFQLRASSIAHQAACANFYWKNFYAKHFILSTIFLSRYEPALFTNVLVQQSEVGWENAANDFGQATHIRQLMPVAQVWRILFQYFGFLQCTLQPLIPSTILSIVPNIIEMLDDAQVDSNGVSGKKIEHEYYNMA